MLIWKRLGRKKCTGQGCHTTLTVTGSFSHPRSGRRANGILFSFIVNFTTYVKSLLHECFVCTSKWKRQLSIELLWDRNTKSRGEADCFYKGIRLFTQDRERGEEANREQPVDTRVEELQTAIIGMESRFVHSWCCDLLLSCSRKITPKEFQQRYFNLISGALSRSGVPWVRKCGCLCIQEGLVLTKSSVRALC